MTIRNHQIEIAASAARAYELCADVRKWPEHFPPCQRVEVLEERPGYQRFEITALVNGRAMTWTSERSLDEAERLVTFHVLKPIPLLRRMKGAWRIYSTQRGALIVLEHEYELKDDVSGLVPGVRTVADAEEFIRRSLDENSTRELEAYRQVLEDADAGELESCFAEVLVMKVPPDKAYSDLQDARSWPTLLPHCRAINMRYDDGQNQEFVMTVDVRGTDEHIRTVRRCTPGTIEYFQPEPPPVLKEHRGAWRIEPHSEGSRVTSWHRVRLNPAGVRNLWGDISAPEALARVRDAINGNSLSTMQAISRRNTAEAQS